MSEHQSIKPESPKPGDWTDERAKMQYKSIASWPANSGIGISEDTHDTKEQAEAVCQMLKRDGLGGEWQIFPEHVWTEEIKPQNAEVRDPAT